MIGLWGKKKLVYQFELQPACDMNIICYVILRDKTEIMQVSCRIIEMGFWWLQNEVAHVVRGVNIGLKFKYTCFVFPLYHKAYGSVIIFSWKHPSKNVEPSGIFVGGPPLLPLGMWVLYGPRHLYAPGLCKKLKSSIIFMKLLSVTIWFLKPP